MKLAEKTAVITGGATGIGRAVADLLSSEGCRVVVAGRRGDKLRQAAEDWTHEPPLLTRQLDVTDRAAVDDFVDWVDQQCGKIDILVNNAGINSRRRTMSDIDPETWDQVLNTNATGAFNCIRAVLPQMRARQDGVIINVSSISGKRASVGGGVAYCASKFALSGLSMTVGLEEGKHGIRVTNVCPGEVDTPILDQRPKTLTAEHRASILRPEDIAAVVLFVATLPARAHVPELVITPTWAEYA